MSQLNDLRDRAFKTAVDHGFDSATVGEDIALMHSELSEALEDFRNGLGVNVVMFLEKGTGKTFEFCPKDEKFKPIGIPIEMADVIIRILDFCGKYKIDIEKAVLLKMAYNDSREFKHGGKKL